MKTKRLRSISHHFRHLQCRSDQLTSWSKALRRGTERNGHVWARLIGASYFRRRQWEPEFHFIRGTTHNLLPCPWASFLLVVVLGARRSPLSYPPTRFAPLGHPRASPIDIGLPVYRQLLFNPGLVSDTDVFSYLNECEPNWMGKNVPKSCSFFTVMKWKETGTIFGISTEFLSYGGLDYQVTR